MEDPALRAALEKAKDKMRHVGAQNNSPKVDPNADTTGSPVDRSPTLELPGCGRHVFSSGIS